MTRARWCFVLLVAALLILPSCSSNGTDSVLQGNRGNVRFSLSSDAVSTQSTGGRDIVTDSAATPDTPAVTLDGDDHDEAERRIQEAHVTFASLLARNLDGQLVDVDIELPATIDVFATAMDGSVSLPMGSLPAATYDQLVIVITSVDLLTVNGTQVTITPPGGGWTVLVPVCPFEVVAGETTSVQLLLRRHRSFGYDGAHFRFEPQFDCNMGS